MARKTTAAKPRVAGGRGVASDTSMNPPEGGAVVRMYCTGLGDCFLIALPDAAKQVGYVMIDCGAWKGTPGAKEWMTAIMSHIRATVGLRGIDVLVASHQHWDHLSGFAQAKAVFDQIQVKQVWMPWTENAGDPVALRLAQERRMAASAVAAAARRLEAMGVAAADDPAEAARRRGVAQNLNELLKFMGHTPAGDEGARLEDEALMKAGIVPRTAGGEAGLSFGELAAGPTTEDLMELVKEAVRPREPRYIKPSKQALTDVGFPGVRVYALGPPTDLKLLGKDDPSKGEKSEVYLRLQMGGLPLNSQESGLLAAAGGAVGGASAGGGDELTEWRERAFPFNWGDRIGVDRAFAHEEHGAFFRERYGRDESDPAEGWRKIDSNWLEMAEQLALNLDDHVNNTSLALAFELGSGPDAPVLLFPGDAQVGNWLSWHKLDESGDFARSLLSRTVLYKVGHHGSHNATLKALGLKLMNQKDRLVAMVPVDEKEARKPKGSNKDGWEMPYGKLYEDLMERTEGRVMRADTGVELLEKGRPPGWSAAKWDRFRKDTRVHRVKGADGEPRPLFVEYTIRP